MSKYLSILGRQPEISLAELESMFGSFGKVKRFSENLATFSCDFVPDISRLGGTQKLAQKLEMPVIDYLKNLEPGKITLGFSDYSNSATKKSATLEVLKLKNLLKRHGRSVRALENHEPALSTATSHHNQLGEKKNHVEIIKTNKEYYRLVGVQNITSYAHRDQTRPARDARVGMLPPKLAQILINLCGPMKKGSTILDPFCGTGVVLQEAALMGYSLLGSDINPRMIEYTKKNLSWLDAQLKKSTISASSLTNDSACDIIGLCVGDATSFDWQKEIAPKSISAVACESYLGPPMSSVPIDIKLKTAKNECRPIILGFLKNLSNQIPSNTPVVVAIPAWLRSDGSYSRLDILDDIDDLGYNVKKLEILGDKPLLYHREGQIVAREILNLRKK